MTKPAAGPQPDARTVYYAEDHGALRWPLLAAGLAAPVISLACAVAAIVLRNVPLLVVCLLARGLDGPRPAAALRLADRHPAR
jgi:hypothetical protein